MEIEEIKPLAVVVNNMIGKKTYFFFEWKEDLRDPSTSIRNIQL